MKTSAKRKTRGQLKRKLAKVQALKYKSLEELRRSPEYRAYIADYSRKQGMLHYLNYSKLSKKQQKKEAKYNG